ncbi:MAG: DUF2231 domain-containing protein [Chloroflexota bacterium]
MIKEQVHTHEEGIKATASIAGHPLHPIIIPFPIAFLTGALVTDIVYWLTAEEFWARMSFWLIVGGLVMGLLAAVLGLIDFVTIERARSHAAGWIHLGGNSLALILAFVNLWLRWNEPAAAVIPWGILLSLLIAGILGIGGWYGGELAYRHKIGVIEDGH